MTDDGTVRTFEPGDLAPIRAIMEASLREDSIPGFVASDIERALIRLPADPGGTVVALDDGAVVGYCTPRHDDLTVDPVHRRRGHGRRLVSAARRMLAARGEESLALYVPSHLPGSEAFARQLGFRYRSSLWSFELPAEGTVPLPAFPPDVVVRPWQPDEDVGRYIRFVAAAFEGHPTPMNLNEDVVRRVNAEPGFDPGDILSVAPAANPATPIGFARVELIAEPSGPPTAYVNLIGVLPAWRRRGLGRELLRWGVTRLRERGARRIQLTVEAANERATALYLQHGFEPEIEWPHWAVPTSGQPASDAGRSSTGPNRSSALR
jgi:mycothiol synthase